jgi:hypothetical protein
VPLTFSLSARPQTGARIFFFSFARPIAIAIPFHISKSLRSEKIRFEANNVDVPSALLRAAQRRAARHEAPAQPPRRRLPRTRQPARRPHRRIGLPRTLTTAPARTDVGALLGTRERRRADTGHRARGAGQGEPRVLGTDHAAVRVPEGVQARTGRELGPRETRGVRAYCEWRGRYAAQWMVEWPELGRRGAQARG